MTEIYSTTRPKFRNYTYSFQSYIDAASKDSQIVSRFCTPHYRDYWAVTISVRNNLSPDEHKAVYKHFSDKVRDSQIAMYWVREFDDGLYWENTCGEVHLHYHGIAKLFNICGNSGRKVNRQILKKLFRSAMPEDIRPFCEVWVGKTAFATSRDLQYWINYIHKAKVSGTDSQGKWSDDVLKTKRFLYPNMKVAKLRKIGKIGDFWATKKTEVWGEIQQETAQRHKDREALLESATCQQRQEAQVIADFIDWDYDKALLHVVKVGVPQSPSLEVSHLGTVRGLKSPAKATQSHTKPPVSHARDVKPEKAPFSPTSASFQADGRAWRAVVGGAFDDDS